MEFGQGFTDREPEPGPVVMTDTARGDLAEWGHHLHHILGRDTDATVNDPDGDTTLFLDGDVNRYVTAGFGEFDRVGKQVENDLF